MEIKELEIVNTTQHLFDCFNGFMLSSDTKVFGKLLARTLLVDSVKHLPGDIVECGVFKGTGMFTFLKLKRFLCPNSGKKVVGFDFFDSEKLVESLSGLDKQAMGTLFEKRNYKHDKGQVELFRDFIVQSGFEEHEFDLVPGDITKTAAQYAAERPGFRISLLYIDLDVEEPTYETLRALWDRVVKGGIVVFDEYAFHKWSESAGADRFFADKDVELKTLNYICPSAYVVKK
jgi:hypothetical protein|tara:strand:+ start:4505 stop:5200 length:696 start_codon:yes stop_codon:yes gene_type:complete